MKTQLSFSVLLVGFTLWTVGCNTGTHVDPIGTTDLSYGGGSGSHSHDHSGDTTKSDTMIDSCSMQMGGGMMGGGMMGGGLMGDHMDSNHMKGHSMDSCKMH